MRDSIGRSATWRQRGVAVSPASLRESPQFDQHTMGHTANSVGAWMCLAAKPAVPSLTSEVHTVFMSTTWRRRSDMASAAAHLESRH